MWSIWGSGGPSTCVVARSVATRWSLQGGRGTPLLWRSHGLQVRAAWLKTASANLTRLPADETWP